MFKADTSKDGTSAMLSRRRHVLCGSTALCAFAVALSLSGGASAQAVNWTGGNGNWNDASKWSSGTVPNGVFADPAVATPTVIGTGAAGTVTIDSSATTRNIQVGNGDTLQIINGGVLDTTPSVNTNGINTIGLSGIGSGSGTMLITGNGSTWNAGIAGVRVGNGATGTLTISDHGRLTMNAGLLSIGMNAGGNGTLTIDNGSAADTEAVRLGYNGATGTLNITNGGTLQTSMTSATENHVGDGSGAVPGTGIVNISGAGSSWTVGPAGELTFGHGAGATGTVTISAGGRLTFQNTSGVQIGYQGGSGSLTVDGAGSMFDNAGAFVIGGQGGSTGAMTVSNGATVIAGHNNTIIGYQGGTGTLNVTTGATFTSVEAVFVGNFGTGTLNVLSGGKLNITGGFLDVGAQSSGTATIDGPGSVVNAQGMGVGDVAPGTLTMSNGGQYNGGSVLIGLNSPNAVGTVNMSSGAVLNSTDRIAIGWASGTGTLTATGAGTVLKATNDITIANGIPGFGTTTGTLTVSDGAAVQAAKLVVGFDQGAVATLNIGDGGKAGTISAPTIEMGGASSTINFNHNEADYVFSSVISNYQSGPSASGAVNFIGSGTTTLTAVSTYTAPTNINAGHLVIASGGSIADSSLTTVNSGATLSGAGTVGNVNVASGGAIVQNSTDKLTVKDITFAAGSTYQAALGAGGLIGSIAANNATINGGTVKVTAGSGFAMAPGSYTIVTTTGNVSGKFSDLVASDLAFLQAGLSYSANAVNLQLARNDVSFASVAGTPNQRAVAAGLQSLGTGNIVVAALLQQNEAGARQAFDALSGEAHASGQTALIVNALAVGDTVNSRLQQPYGASTAPGASVASGYAEDSYAALSYATKAPAKAQWTKAPWIKAPPVPVTPTVVYSSWAQGMGSWLDRDGNGNAGELKSSTGGVISGVDATWLGMYRFGVAGGYSHSDINVDGRGSSLDVDSYHVSIYGGARQGRFGLQGGFIYSWNDIASNRRIAFPLVIQNVLANYSSDSKQFFGELNYQYYFTGTSWIETFAGANYLRHDTDAFAETGGAAALAVARHTQDVTFTTLGLRGAALLGQSGDAAFIGRGTVGWRHALGDVDSAIQAAFAGGTPFNVTGVPITADAVVGEAGIDVNVRQNMTLGLSWSGQFGDGASENRVNGKFVYRW